MIGFRPAGLDQLTVQHEVDVNSLTGAAQLSIPLRLTPGRNAFGPQLALGYGSGQRNSAFGIGCFVSGLTSVGIDTREQLPAYDGSERFVFSGGQSLLPKLEESGGSWRPVVRTAGAFRIERYSSQHEKAFERYERWTDAAGRMHWRLYGRDGTVSVFGRALDNSTRIADPQDPDRRVYQWLLEAQYDRRGNAIHYEYKPEDLVGVNQQLSYEADRIRHSSGPAQRYPKRIRYGNSIPLSANQPSAVGNEWRFEAVFDYGEHGSAAVPTHPAASAWSVRSDSFSTHRSGFEVRTHRLCRRVLMFHHFAELNGGAATLVGATELTHEPKAEGANLKSVTYRGYKRTSAGTWEDRALPSLTLQYSESSIATGFTPGAHNENLPAGFSDAQHQWMDLKGEGVPGILSRQDGVWYFKENLGGGRFSAQHQVEEVPASVSAAFRLQDFDNDGNLNLVGFEGREAGYYQRNRDNDAWEGFRAFHQLPRIDFANARVQFLDLNGDGYADLLVERSDRLTWYPSDGKTGFKEAQELSRRSRADGGAPTLTANSSLKTRFADMTGDGLLDMVQVNNGRVEYWPNLGLGQFGAGIVMESAPRIEDFAELEDARLKLVDLDGTGTADLLYVGRGEIRFWFNQSGNQFGPTNRIGNLPYIDELASIQVFDFLGDGSRCLVWSSPIASHEGQAIQYLRLSGETPPRLLVGTDNGVGRRTALHYRSSSFDFLRDKNGPRPWKTRLPRHSMVVHRLEGLDEVTGHKQVTQFAYHDGTYDDAKRRFVGFGMVDTIDAEQPDSAGTPEEQTPPTITRSWYHSGADHGFVRRREDFYQGDAQARALPTPEVDNLSSLSTTEQLEAYRSVAGLVWRQEIYAQQPDGSQAQHPFRTTEFAYRIHRRQPETEDFEAGFAVDQSESLNYEYEESPSDPRVNHSLLLAVDGVGNVGSRATVSYARRPSASARPEQLTLQAELTQTDHQNIDDDLHFELGIEVEARHFHLTGLSAPPGEILQRSELISQIQAALAAPVSFHAPETSARHARLVRRRRNRFWNAAQSDVVGPGLVVWPSLLHHIEQAVFPTGSVDTLFDSQVDAGMLTADARYRAVDGFWWADETTYEYLSESKFYRLRRETNPFAGTRTVTFDPHFLLVTSEEDQFGNRTESTPDYRVLASRRIKDVNDNASEVVYDALGVAIATSVRGHQIGDDGSVHAVGDEDLAGYASINGATTADVLTNPAGHLQGATRLFYYDLEAHRRGDGPPATIQVERETHRHQGEGGPAVDGRLRTTVQYFDGFGRPIQTKTNAEPGPAIARASGSVVVDAQGRPTLAHSNTRWLCSGGEVHNNKGWLIRRYEPFFSSHPAFETDLALRTFGVTTRTRFDTLGRARRQDLANNTFTTVEYNPWLSQTSDPTDNVIGSRYESDRLGLAPGDPERKALVKAQALANTPTIAETDGLGRPTRLRELDVDGSERLTITRYGPMGVPVEVTDARGNVAFAYRHDMLGRPVWDRSADGGVRITLLNALGVVAREWDARGVQQRHSYDESGRRTQTHVSGATDYDASPVDQVVQRTIYGDNPVVAQAKDKNARGRPVQEYDDAGQVAVLRYGFSGAALDLRRRLRMTPKGTVNLDDPVSAALTGAELRTQSWVDALGRAVTQKLPDGTTREFSYSVLGHTTEVRVTTADGAMNRTLIASDVRTNARGQRTHLLLGNGVATSNEYDPQTFALTRLWSRKTTGAPRDYLDISYTYDPSGNITRWEDRVQSPATTTSVLSGLTVSSACEFSYDAFYQLRQATGRVHQGLLQQDFRSGRDGSNPIKGTRHLSLNNGAAVERYTRNYTYDLAGNLKRIGHQGQSRNWGTDIWTSGSSNRSLPAKDLNGITNPSPENDFDASGHTIRLPHLRAMDWNFAGRLSRALIIDRSASGEPDDAEYYVYDSTGLRVRRITERFVSGQVEVSETTYVDGCEIRRVSRNNHTRLLRFTSHITDGSSRLATLHQWSVDLAGLETDDIGKKNLHYVLSNHLGTTSLELDAAADVISYEEYFPFGGTSFIAGNSVRQVKLKEYRYSGKCRDDATGLYCYEYRYYAPFIGNWVSPDPAGPVDGLNLYRFVQNNPIRFVDANGLYTRLLGNAETVPENIQAARYTNTPEARALIQAYLSAATFEINGQIYQFDWEVVPRESAEGQFYWFGEADESSARLYADRVETFDFEEEDPVVGDPNAVHPPTEPEPEVGGTGERNETPAPPRQGGDPAIDGNPEARGSGPRGSGPGAGAQGEGPGGGGESETTGLGESGTGTGAGEVAGPGSGASATPGTAEKKPENPGGTRAGGKKDGSGAGRGGEGQRGGDANPTTPTTPGSRGGRGNLAAPAPPPGVPVSADGIPYSPELPIPEVTPEAGTPVADPTQAQRGNGNDTRGEPASESGTGVRPGGTEGGGQGVAGGHDAAGSVDGEGEGRDGGQPGGSRLGLKGGVGTHELPESLSWLDDAIDYLQIGLDVVGLIPGFGEIADGINGVISLARGDHAGAALSFAAMIPFAGWAATAGKFGRRAVNAADAVADVTSAVSRHGDEAADVLAAGARGADEVAQTISASARGNPRAILRGLGELSGRQREVLEQLGSSGSELITSKRGFGNSDLAALTAATGDEFAMFTAGGRRLIVRGTAGGVPITPARARELAEQGWRWSSHTHPGAARNVLRSSDGDRAVLEAMGQSRSGIFNSNGERALFGPAGDMLGSWTPW